MRLYCLPDFVNYSLEKLQLMPKRNLIDSKPFASIQILLNFVDLRILPEIRPKADSLLH
jgi:hypothetical protein